MAASLAQAAVLLCLLAVPRSGVAAGRAGLVENCSVPGAALADVREPFDLALESAAEAVLISFDRSGTTHTHALLRMPGCVTVPLAGGPLPPGVHPMAVGPSGARLVAAADPADGRPRWWYSPRPEIALAPVPAPAGDRVAGQPVLSDDGAWAAWVQQETGAGVQNWHARELTGAGALEGTTSRFGAGSYEVLGFDPEEGSLTFARNLSEIVEVDTRSGIVAGALRPGDVASQPATFRSLRVGWFAWDAYREDTPWRAVWSVAGKAGRYDADWSKMIVHASVNPSGTHAALSLESRFGRVPLGSDALVVVRLADGEETFRKKLPRFTRTRVAFLGERHLAWTEGDRVVVARVEQ